MNKIIDFNCIYQDASVINEEVIKNIDVGFPEAYTKCETMILIAEQLKKYEDIPFYQLPFCHTLEGESMGGIINLGDEKNGPRAKDYIVDNLDELLKLPEIDYSKGRMAETLKACKSLSDKGENVMISISGPFTIMNVLIDPRFVFRTFRKNPETMQKVLDKLKKELLTFVEHAQSSGVNLISYADSSGGLNILGPKFAQQVVEMFTYPFLKQVEAILEKDKIVILCPKTTLALTGTQKAEFKDLELEEELKYTQACLEVIGRTSFVGQMCIKNRGFKLSNKKIKSIELV